MNTTFKVAVTVKHDKGKCNIIVWATSIDEAKQRVINTEGCPLSAIIKAEAVRPTIYDIKRLTSKTSPYYFSRKTMKFFKQSMKDIKVKRIDELNFLIEAFSPLTKDYSKRVFNIVTNELTHI